MIANKTVFIIITRGFLVRNMLRSGVLRLLNAAGIRTVIFFPLLGKTTEVPSSLRKELEGPLVKIIGVREARLGRIHKVFCHLAKFLVFTKSTWTYCLVSVKNDQQRSDALAWIERLIFSRLSQWRVLKRLARAIEEHVFRQRHYAEYFEAERPSVVFSTSIISTLDLLFMKEARRRGIPTISIPKGWDNIAKIFYRFNGVVDAFRTEHALNAPYLYASSQMGFMEIPAIRSMDIDEPHDFLYAEAILQSTYVQA